MSVPVANLTPNRPIGGTERTIVGDDCVRRYGKGQSIRAIAADLNRSYGFVHGLLTERGVTLRPRGGYRRTPGRTHSAATHQPTGRTK